MGSHQTYDASLNAILKELPQVVFLNVDHSFDEMAGFVADLYRYCELPPCLVGVSKTKEKAYDLLKCNFSDLLLLPMSELDLRKCVFDIKKRFALERSDKLCLKSYGDYQYLDLQEILYLKADNNTTDFHMLNGSIISAYKTLKNFEKTLPHTFIRMHRSYIVNSNYISRINYGKSLCSIGSANVKIPFTKKFLKNINRLNKQLSMNSFSLMGESSLS